MAFTQYNLERLHNQCRGGFDVFVYRTDDTIAEVVANGYLNNKQFGFKSPGQSPRLIFAYCSDGLFEIIWNYDTETATVATAPTSTGWASYVDTQYTAVAPFTLTANTDTVLPNNAGNVIDFQKPVDVVTFYDSATQSITGRTGDNLDVMVYFRAIPSAANQWLDVWIDIGGSIGELYRQTFSFPRGAGTERGVLYALPSAYTLGTWQANGGQIYIRSNAAVDIHDINANFDRSHKAR